MLAAAAVVALGVSLSAAAQTTSAPATTATLQSDSGSSSSTSAQLQAYLNPDNFLSGIAGATAEPAPSGIASPQYGGQKSPQYPGYESRWSHIAFEASAGFTIPVGNDTHYSQADINNGILSPSESTGYNFNVGGGWNFSKHLGALVEFSFHHMGMPGDYLNALETANGISSGGLGGNINTWSLTIDPIYYVPFSHKSGAYVTGGGGFYRKVTNFTEPVESCYYYCISQAETIDHFSSNQGGLNIGLGFYRKIFGEDSNGKFFAEVRYVWVNSPKADSSNSYQGSGTEALIPVTFGVRF
jgi:peptidoglycan hydrolase-like protein with peptidoglycan-binding domain